MGQLLKQTEFANHKGVTEAYISAYIKRDEVPLVKGNLDLEVTVRYWNKRLRNEALDLAVVNLASFALKTFFTTESKVISQATQ